MGQKDHSTIAFVQAINDIYPTNYDNWETYIQNNVDIEHHWIAEGWQRISSLIRI